MRGKTTPSAKEPSSLEEKVLTDNENEPDRTWAVRKAVSMISLQEKEVASSLRRSHMKLKEGLA